MKTLVHSDPLAVSPSFETDTTSLVRNCFKPETHKKTESDASAEDKMLYKQVVSLVSFNTENQHLLL